MASHRQLRTPLYGGRPFWWGDDDVSGPDALTNKSTLAPVSRVEHKLLDQSTTSGEHITQKLVWLTNLGPIYAPLMLQYEDWERVCRKQSLLFGFNKQIRNI